jgi:thioredoxin reductase (NADPH)
MSTSVSPLLSKRDLQRNGVVARGQSKIAELHGRDGQLAAVALKSGELLPFPHLFLFLGAKPATEWLDDVVARDEEGFILTGAKQTSTNLFEADVPGVFAAGDGRSASTKRCATAISEVAMAVQFVHAHLVPRSKKERDERRLHPS